jgi:hypothetical protein
MKNLQLNKILEMNYKIKVMINYKTKKHWNLIAIQNSKKTLN